MIEKLKTLVPPLLKGPAQILESALFSCIYPTGFRDYSENRYGRVARKTTRAFRTSLLAYQVPAILQHFGSLERKVFLDMGSGDIVLGDALQRIGYPATYFAHDLSLSSLKSGLRRMRKSGINTDNLVLLHSRDFDFNAIENESVDFAFSNSLFSHLTVNSIILCLKNLAPKMKHGATYLSSMLVVPEQLETEPRAWQYHYSEIISYPNRDPYHYSERQIHRFFGFQTGFEVSAAHDYGHPLQKLIEFTRA